ncbi:MAG: hypothetical protein ABIE47_13150 [Pseudomonadota bacterium]
MFQISAAEFNDLPKPEKYKYLNTLRYEVKAVAVEFAGLKGYDPREMRGALTAIDRRVQQILFA